MKKILIVDDEYYFRQALKVSLPWEELGFEICGEAKNGEEAFGKVKDLDPDIAIVDINMPVMDGLEFTEAIKENHCNVKIILLTGHSEFAYAKQAVQLGVHNYLLKPVDEEELKKTLLQVKELIEKESSIRIEMELLEKQVKENIPILKNRFLNELIQGDSLLSIEKTVKKFEYFNIGIISECYQAVTIELDSKEETEWSEEDRQLWMFAVSNIASEFFQQSFSFDLCYDNNDRICFLTGSGIQDSAQQEGVDIVCICERIREAAARYLKFTVTIGIGNIYKDLRDISISYKESVFALKNKLIFGQNNVISYNVIEESGFNANCFRPASMTGYSFT